MEEKTAVVTGASRGIGLALAESLNRRGYRVYGLCRRPGPLSAVRYLACDVTDREAVKSAFTQIQAETGGVDLLICNAGMGISGAAEFTEASDYHRQMEVNLTGAVNCARQVIAPMREKGAGKIIFISSLAAIFPLPFQSFYSASKAAVNAFSDALGIEAAPFGIETCTVMLNDVKTEFTENRRKSAAGDDIYGGRIEKSVGKMEASEQNGMSPQKVADIVCSLLGRKHLPSHKIAGFSNELLGLLYRVLPAGVMLKLLGKLYG